MFSSLGNGATYRLALGDTFLAAWAAQTIVSAQPIGRAREAAPGYCTGDLPSLVHAATFDFNTQNIAFYLTSTTFRDFYNFGSNPICQFSVLYRRVVPASLQTSTLRTR